MLKALKQCLYSDLLAIKHYPLNLPQAPIFLLKTNHFTSLLIYWVFVKNLFGHTIGHTIGHTKQRKEASIQIYINNKKASIFNKNKE